MLDVGAGTGEQAALLSSMGYRVIALDLASSAYKHHRVFPVQEYDGFRLPLDDASIDVVFSSNLLEHLSPLEPLMVEMARVLRPNGIAAHVLPNSVWRIWTTLLHPLWVAKRLMQRLIGVRGPAPILGTDSQARRKRSSGMRLLFPARHGEMGNFLTETWYFSEAWWRGRFAGLNWEVESVAGCGVFYSGTMLVGSKLGLQARIAIARLLGSASTLFVLQPVPGRLDRAPDAGRDVPEGEGRSRLLEAQYSSLPTASASGWIEDRLSVRYMRFSMLRSTFPRRASLV